MKRPTLRHGVALILVLVAISGAACGQKGPLYLPDESSTVVTRPATPAAPVPATPSNPAPEPAATEPDDADDSDAGTP